eukprot:196560-Rhodomonas_salina.1
MLLAYPPPNSSPEVQQPHIDRKTASSEYRISPLQMVSTSEKGSCGMVVRASHEICVVRVTLQSSLMWTWLLASFCVTLQKPFPDSTSAIPPPNLLKSSDRHDCRPGIRCRLGPCGSRGSDLTAPRVLSLRGGKNSSSADRISQRQRVMDSMLRDAARSGDVQMVRWLCENGANVSCPPLSTSFSRPFLPTSFLLVHSPSARCKSPATHRR